jgi:prevent-host-death family protein
MGMSITDEIRSITDLKRNTNQILKQVHDTGRPVVLTVNGKAEAVLIDAREYEKILNSLAMLKLLLAAEKDLKKGRFRDADVFFREFRRAKKIQG